MSYEIRETTEGGLRVTVSHYKESENIVDIFPPCYTHDTTRSREARLDMVDAIIRNLEGVIREQIAQEVEGRVITWASLEGGVPLHSDCWHCGYAPVTNTCDDSREYFGKAINKQYAAIVRGTK